MFFSFNTCRRICLNCRNMCSLCPILVCMGTLSFLSSFPFFFFSFNFQKFISFPMCVCQCLIMFLSLSSITVYVQFCFLSFYLEITILPPPFFLFFFFMAMQRSTDSCGVIGFTMVSTGTFFGLLGPDTVCCSI